MIMSQMLHQMKMMMSHERERIQQKYADHK
jgi:hypothetical protein